MTIEEKNYKYIFLAFLFIMTLILIFVSNSLSVSYKEALNVLDNSSVLSYLTKPTLFIFGQNDFAVRFPFISFYVLSSLLMYYLTNDFFKNEFDRLINILIFMLLPGILSASLLINSSIVVIFCLLAYLTYFKIYEKHNYYALAFFLFVDNSFAILFLALFFYSLKTKENRLIIISLVLFGLSMTIYGFDTGGKPKGYLLDTFGIYASIFSPFLFLYFFYAIYRAGIKGNRTLLWYIAFTALVFSLLISFRQRISIEDFAPYVVIALPIMTRLFFHTFRVRLPEFRKNYILLVKLSLGTLFLMSTLTLYNKPLYLLIQDPEDHFVYNYHHAKEIANILKKNNINEAKLYDKRLQKRLEFYGISKGDKYLVSTKKLFKYDEKFEIYYLHKKLVDIYVYKVK